MRQSGKSERIRSPKSLRRLGLGIPCVWWFCGGTFPTARAGTNVVTAPPRSDPVKELIHAAFDGDSHKISVLLSNGVDGNARRGPRLTAWQAAKVKGHADIMELLVKAGADTHAGPPKAGAILDWYGR